jgi:hypothetical protein
MAEAQWIKEGSATTLPPVKAQHFLVVVSRADLQQSFLPGAADSGAHGVSGAATGP